MKNQELFKELYLLCFTEDLAEDADFLFEKVFSKAELIFEEKDGKPVSMLFLMDCTLMQSERELPFYYLYAACTHPSYRGKGIMGRLLQKAKDFAKEKGKEGIILKPATPSLFKFYKGYGFFDLFKVAKANISAAELTNIPKAIPFELSLEDWWKKRQAILPSFSDAFASFPKELFCAAAAGCKIVTDNKGSFVVYEEREGILLCKECLFEGENFFGVLSLVKTLMEEKGLHSAELRLPQSNTLGAAPFFENQIFSVCSNEGISAENPYHGFAFD